MKNRLSIVKFMVFLLIFIVILLSLFLLYIIPIMKEYKTNKIALKKYEKLYKAKARELKSYNLLKEKLSKKYKKEIKIANIDIDKDLFDSFLKRFFENIKFTKVEKIDDGVRYSILAKMSGKDKFMLFLNSLSKFKYLLRIDFPIIMKKLEKSYEISFNVTIFHKKLK